MATQQGYRIVRFPRPDALEPDEYSSWDPAVEGAVLTPPNTTVTEEFIVWSDYLKLGYVVAFSGTWNDAGTVYGAGRLLLVEYDDADVLDTVDLGPSGIIGRPGADYTDQYGADHVHYRAAVQQYRYLVSGGDIGDELSYNEACKLAGHSDGQQHWFVTPPPPRKMKPLPPPPSVDEILTAHGW